MSRADHVGRRLVVAVLAAVGLAMCGGDEPISALVTSGDDLSSSFIVERWTELDYEATDLSFLPDGRALLLIKGGWSGAGTGLVKLLDTDGTFVDDALELPVCADGERGLLGIALDPDFEQTPYVYLFYTRQMSECAASGLLIDSHAVIDDPVWNRVSRFTFDGTRLDPTSELVLVDELPGHQTSHNGGALVFLHDRTLLIGVGEGTYHRSRETDFVAGKVLRISVDGDLVPTGNPFTSPDGGIKDLVYASGLRNPFRIAVDDATGTIVTGEVGTDDFEEVNIIEAGKDYGFPDVEGPRSVDGSARPALVYEHRDDCISIIGGDFVPAKFVPGAEAPMYTFSDLGCGGVWAMTVSDDDSLVRLTGPLGYGVSALVYGPDGALYLVGIGPGPRPVSRLVRTDAA